jgi:hypothetical protein
MDFITELLESDGYDALLVIVCKLTKYGVFVPCRTGINEQETARLFWEHVVVHFGLPLQIICDRDARWRHLFWEEKTRLMGSKRALTTSYHPQADGQTEILNQFVETALLAFIGAKSEWKSFIGTLALSYNTTPHSSSELSPAYLLRGFKPRTATLLAGMEPVERRVDAGGEESMNVKEGGSTEANLTDVNQVDPVPTRHVNTVPAQIADSRPIADPRAGAFIEEFEALRSRAKEALLLAQVFQRRAYNKGRLDMEFEVGDFVVINAHSLRLLRDEKGRGKKLLLKYDGPFEISEQLGPVTYRLRLPISYGIHPVINIAHLEPYKASPYFPIGVSGASLK